MGMIYQSRKLLLSAKSKSEVIWGDEREGEPSRGRIEKDGLCEISSSKVAVTLHMEDW